MKLLVSRRVSPNTLTGGVNVIDFVISKDMAYQFAIDWYKSIIAEIKNEQDRQEDLQESKETHNAT